MRISDWSSDVCSSDLALLLGFMAAGLYIQPVIDPDALPAVLTGLAGVAAMAVQNGTGRLVLGNHAPTTIMTGNTTQAVIDAVDILRLPAGAGCRRHRSLPAWYRSEEHTSELQSLMRISYAVFCLKKKKKNRTNVQEKYKKS